MFYLQKIENSFKSACEDFEGNDDFFRIQIFGIKAVEGLSVSGFNVHQLQQTLRSLGWEYVRSLQVSYIGQLKTHLMSESWQNVPVQTSDQLITLKLNQIDHSQIVEPSEIKDFVITSRRKYKVVSSCLEF